MDQERTKGTSSASSPTAGSSKNSFKSQQRHHEHNYTNPSIDDTSITITKVCSLSEGSTLGERESPRIRSSSRSQSKGDAGEGNQRTAGMRASSGSERSAEVKNKVIKKDVFNRIRRSEEELQKAAEMVRGGMTFQTASDTFNIPISTIRFYMARRGILPQRRRGRGSSGVRDDDLIHPPFEIIHYRLPDIDKPI
ncbi:UNVERIFIED_CONTAM: hypothetical protein PYX00_002237 [Menopon gallinae]|uniref:HTH psq-type domain-containing protein n=1 Tax=Menopon gallinae TaxID=328185 RepID=A0AAW2IH77_9NEOP